MNWLENYLTPEPDPCSAQCEFTKHMADGSIYCPACGRTIASDTMDTEPFSMNEPAPTPEEPPEDFEGEY